MTSPYLILKHPPLVAALKGLIQFDVAHFPETPVMTLQWLDLNILTGPFKVDTLEVLNVTLGIVVEEIAKCNTTIAEQDKVYCQNENLLNSSQFIPCPEKLKKYALKAKSQKKTLKVIRDKLNLRIDEVVGC